MGEAVRGRCGVHRTYSHWRAACEWNQRGAASLENLQERNTLIGKTVGELLASNQTNSFWRKALIVENEEKPSGLFLIGFQRIFSDKWGNFEEGRGLRVYCQLERELH